MREGYEKLPFLGDFIDGQFLVPTRGNGEVRRVSPADPKDLVIEGLHSFDHVSAACEAARRAFRTWSETSLDERKNALTRLKETYITNADILARIISREVGKPLWEAKQEVQAMINKIGVTFDDALKLVASQRIEKAAGAVDGFLRFKPRGVMAVVGPFNFPGHLPNGHFIPALLMGNTIAFKPSELAPATGQFVAQLFEQAHFPKGVFNLVQGNGETGRRLVMHEAVEGVLFTGSYETGFRIKQDTLSHFWKIIALEMGGKNTAIVWDDCDFSKAIYENLVGAFVTTGQRCTATSRIIVRRSIADKFIARFHEASKKLTIGHPFDNPFMGPLISGGAVDKYLRFQGIAKREHCQSIMRGKILEDRDGFYVTPSINIVTKPDPTSVYQASELFGPNVAFYMVDEIQEALQIVNQSSYGLAMSVFSDDREIFDYAFKFSRMGIVNWNRSTVGASSRLPFGGMGKSGNNQPAGTFAIYTCTYPVASLEDGTPFDASKILPGMNLSPEDFKV